MQNATWLEKALAGFSATWALAFFWCVCLSFMLPDWPVIASGIAFTSTAALVAISRALR